MKAPAKAIAQHVRPPMQDRSRASFERVLDAAVELLEEKGYEGFTLLEVSGRAHTSIGSIYCRVKGKKDLIQAVQLHVLAKLDAETTQFTDPAQWKDVELRSLVPHLIRELGEFLRRHAAILRALQSFGAGDVVIVGKGEASYWRMADRCEAVLLLRSMEIRHPKPKHAVQVCFEIPYAAIQKYLGIGIRPDVRISEGSWQQLLDDLATLCLAFLQVESQASTSSAEAGESAPATAPVEPLPTAPGKAKRLKIK